MLAAERQARILAEVEGRGAARVTELAAQLGVSNMTIRRDLTRLDAQHRLAKVQGGATARSPHTFTERRSADNLRHTSEQAAIADAAAALITPGSAIGLAPGLRAEALARRLGRARGLTVVTTSMRVAHAIDVDGPGAPNVLVSGGVCNPSGAMVGPGAVSSFCGLDLDAVFLDTECIHVRAGFTIRDLFEAETSRALVRASRRLVVLADHRSWGVTGIGTVAALSEADAVVTDERISPTARVHLASRVRSLLVASTTAHPRSGPPSPPNVSSARSPAARTSAASSPAAATADSMSSPRPTVPHHRQSHR